MHCSVAAKLTAEAGGGLTVAQAVAARGQAGGRGSSHQGHPATSLPGSQGHRAKPARATRAQLARAGPASKTLPSGAPQPPTSPLSNVTRRRARMPNNQTTDLG